MILDIFKHPLAKLMEQTAQRGILFNAFSEYKEQLPNNCEYVIQMNNKIGAITCAEDSDSTKGVTYGSISDFDIQNAVERLAPILCKVIELESELTKIIHFSNCCISIVQKVFCWNSGGDNLPLRSLWQR